MVFSQAFQDLRNVVAMFGHTPGVDQDLIYVDEYEFVEEIPGNLVHEILEYGGGVDQWGYMRWGGPTLWTKWHCGGVLMPLRREEVNTGT